MNPLPILQTLCHHLPNRAVGSEGNRMATTFFEQEIQALGWETETPWFDAIDWNEGSASILSC